MFVADEKAMTQLGIQLSQACQNHAIIYLYGSLGAGKTTFVRGFLRGLGFKGKVKSPTYSLVEPYEINHQWIYHFDLYRVKHFSELEFIGVSDYMHSKTICLIEWPENGGEALPASDISCYIKHLDQGREMRIVANSEWGNTILKRFQYEA